MIDDGNETLKADPQSKLKPELIGRFSEGKGSFPLSDTINVNFAKIDKQFLWTPEGKVKEDIYRIDLDTRNGDKSSMTVFENGQLIDVRYWDKDQNELVISFCKFGQEGPEKGALQPLSLPELPISPKQEEVGKLYNSANNIIEALNSSEITKVNKDKKSKLIERIKRMLAISAIALSASCRQVDIPREKIDTLSPVDKNIIYNYAEQLTYEFTPLDEINNPIGQASALLFQLDSEMFKDTSGFYEYFMLAASAHQFDKAKGFNLSNDEGHLSVMPGDFRLFLRDSRNPEEMKTSEANIDYSIAVFRVPEWQIAAQKGVEFGRKWDEINFVSVSEGPAYVFGYIPNYGKGPVFEPCEAGKAGFVYYCYFPNDMKKDVKGGSGGGIWVPLQNGNIIGTGLNGLVTRTTRAVPITAYMVGGEVLKMGGDTVIMAIERGLLGPQDNFFSTK